MKDKDYVEGTAGIYREIIDRAGELSQRQLNEKIKELKQYGNRSGFTNGYQLGKTDRSMISFNSPSIQKEKIKTEGYAKKKVPIYVELEIKEEKPIFAKVKNGGTKLSFAVGRAEKARENPTEKKTIEKHLKKTKNTEYDIIPDIKMDEGIFVPLGEINRLKRDIIEGVRDKTLSGFKRKHKENNPEDFFEDFFVDSFEKIPEKAVNTKICDKLFVTVSNHGQLSYCLGREEPSYVGLDCHYFPMDDKLKEITGQIREKGKKPVYLLPVVFRDDFSEEFERDFHYVREAGFSAYMVRAFDEIGFLRKMEERAPVWCDANIYTFNTLSERFLDECGISCDCVPLELNERQLTQRKMTKSMVMVYGYTPLMLTAQCLLKNTKGRCRKDGNKGRNKGENFFLEDERKKRFRVGKLCDICANRIYNCVPVSLFGVADKVMDMKPCILRMDFVFEDDDEMDMVFDLYVNSFQKMKAKKPVFDFTYGHFRRGV